MLRLLIRIGEKLKKQKVTVSSVALSYVHGDGWWSHLGADCFLTWHSRRIFFFSEDTVMQLWAWKRKVQGLTRPEECASTYLRMCMQMWMRAHTRTRREKERDSVCAYCTLSVKARQLSAYVLHSTVNLQSDMIARCHTEHRSQDNKCGCVELYADMHRSELQAVHLGINVYLCLG